MTKKPKIAILTLRNSYPYGGVWSSLKVVHDFCTRYFEPIVCTLTFESPYAMSLRRLRFHSTVSYEGDYHGFPSYDVGARWAFWEPWHYAATVDSWRTILASFDYIFAVSGTVIAAHPAVLVKKPFVLWASTLYAQDRQQRAQQLSGFRALIDRAAQPVMLEIEKTIIAKAPLIFALSSYSQKEFVSVVPGASQRMLPCGFPQENHEQDIINFYREHELSACIIRRHENPVILAVGRFSDPRKNGALLMRFFKLLYQQDSRVRLVVVGTPPALECYAEYQKQEFFKAIIFTGNLTASELASWYAQATIMVITSYQEGFCIAGLEALSYGLPIVSTRCGGVVDYVRPEETGFLVDLDNHEMLAFYVKKILTDRSLYQKFSENAFVLVKEQFSQTAIYTIFKRGLVRVYPELEAHFSSSDSEIALGNILGNQGLSRELHT